MTCWTTRARGNNQHDEYYRDQSANGRQPRATARDGRRHAAVHPCSRACPEAQRTRSLILRRRQITMHATHAPHAVTLMVTTVLYTVPVSKLAYSMRGGKTRSGGSPPPPPSGIAWPGITASGFLRPACGVPLRTARSQPVHPNRLACACALSKSRVPCSDETPVESRRPQGHTGLVSSGSISPVLLRNASMMCRRFSVRTVGHRQVGARLSSAAIRWALARGGSKAKAAAVPKVRSISWRLKKAAAGPQR